VWCDRAKLAVQVFAVFVVLPAVFWVVFIAEKPPSEYEVRRAAHNDMLRQANPSIPFSERDAAAEALVRLEEQERGRRLSRRP
jgi:hypothetical protein